MFRANHYASQLVTWYYYRYYVAGPAEYGDFTSLVAELISENGVFVAQMGEAPSLSWPSAENSVMKNRFDFIKSLPQYGFKSVVDYEEVRHWFHMRRHRCRHL
jgi:hypothetical protein